MTTKYGNPFRLFGPVLLTGALRKHGGRAVGLEIIPDNDPTPTTIRPDNE